MIALCQFLAVAACCLLAPAPAPPAESVDTDVLVYGGTPAGIAAALAAAEAGHPVELVEPYGFVGGMTTNGLTHTDFHSFEGLTGTFLELTKRVVQHYAEVYGVGAPEVENTFRGTQAEPRVNRLVFEQMLAERPEITVRTRTRLTEVEVVPQDGIRHITGARFTTADRAPLTIRAKIFIDATYEGDLLAAAGVPYRVGREGRDAYGESLAPETADDQVQGDNFRFTLTQVPENRLPPLEPSGYRREDFLALLPLLDAGAVTSVFCPSTGGLYKAHEPPLPNGKHDINDVSRGIVRLSLPDLNDAWPDGDLATRQRIYDAHVRHNVGMLYFLQTDPDVPKSFQKEALQWGFCRDEYPENGHLPEQLYVREGRRMIGRHVFNEHDTDYAPGDARSVLQPDAIALGEYSLNCHGTGHEGPRFGGHHTGEFYKSTPPYQVPYGALVPNNTDNLLVPVAVSSSHVGFCALRLEPIWTSLGQAAGHAAHLALRDRVAVQDMPVAELQARLHEAGAATIYVRDVPPGAPDFAAVQWWGTHGGLHGLASTPEKPGQRGAHLVSQYYEAYPGHSAELNRDLDDDLRDRWLALAEDLGLSTNPLHDCRTRGEFVRQVYKLHNASQLD